MSAAGTSTPLAGGIGLPPAASFEEAREPGGDRSLSRITLRFRDPALERRYHAGRLPFRMVATRISALFGTLTWGGFALLDSLTLQDPSPALFTVRTLGASAVFSVFLATLVVRPGRWIERTGTLSMAVTIVLLALYVAKMSEGSLAYYPPGPMFTMAAVMGFALCATTFIEGVALAVLALGAFLVSATWLRPEPMLTVTFQMAWMGAVIAFAGVGSYLLDRTQRIAWLREADLAVAEDRARALLHNVLPPSIALRKLSGEHPIADDFGDASLLFADIVDFTSLSARLGSTEVVTLLGDLFRRFDRIVARHGLEKIKTIGDCYMAAGGLPDPRPDHVEHLMRAAVEMMEAAARTRTPDGASLSLRIGMHAGPVTAGVIGEARFIFDVWGDTVNLASRMESHGSAGHIQVTEAVRTALGHCYAFDGPHLVEVKGKGPMPVWRLRA